MIDTTKLLRYKLSPHGTVLEEDPQGELVFYSDVQAIIEEYENKVPGDLISIEAQRFYDVFIGDQYLAPEARELFMSECIKMVEAKDKIVVLMSYYGVNPGGRDAKQPN